MPVRLSAAMNDPRTLQPLAGSWDAWPRASPAPAGAAPPRPAPRRVISGADAAGLSQTFNSISGVIVLRPGRLHLISVPLLLILPERDINSSLRAGRSQRRERDERDEVKRRAQHSPGEASEPAPGQPTNGRGAPWSPRASRLSSSARGLLPQGSLLSCAWRIHGGAPRGAPIPFAVSPVQPREQQPPGPGRSLDAGVRAWLWRVGSAAYASGSVSFPCGGTGAGRDAPVCRGLSS